jgi:hypothetical protein
MTRFALFGLVVCLQILMANFLGWRLKAAEFEVAGVMKVDPITFKPFSSKFRICVRGCNWAIFQTWESPTNKIIIEMSDDGNNIFELQHIEIPMENGDWMPASNSYVGSLYPSGFPYRVLDTEIVALFYAYASTCYLNSVTNQLLGPIKFEPRDLVWGDASVSAIYERNPYSPNLPAQIVFLNHYSAKERWTNAVFSASDFTNVSGLTIPEAVSLIRYHANEGRVYTKYEFQVSSVINKCYIDTFTPDLTKRAFVQDQRFSRGVAQVPSITYGVLTNGVWPSLADAKRQPGYKVAQMDWEKIARNHAGGQVNSAGRFSVRAVLIFVFLAGLFSIIGLFRKKKSSQKEKK